MAETNSREINVLDARRPSIRIAIAASILLALIFGWFSIRWQLGNMLAELTVPSEPGAKNTARIAADLAPRDPLANWLLVNTTATGTDASTFGVERVIKLSPADFRWWIEYGRAREQAGDFARAEAALQKAVELAPEYVFPRWQLGNYLLRRNRGDEAFNQLAKAAASGSVYREQVFSLGWEYFERDTGRLEQIAGNAPDARADLAKFYAAKNRAEDSLRVWNSLTEEEKQGNRAGALVIARALYDKNLLRAAREFVRQIGIEPEAQSETIQNGGFERPIGEAAEVYFGWRVSPVEKIDVKLDPTQKREGSRSLRIAFSGYAEPSLYIIYQLVTVEPKTRYRLSFWLRTENLRSAASPPHLEIYNTADARQIAASAPFSTLR